MWLALVMFDYRSTVQLAFALSLNIVQLMLHVGLRPFGGEDAPTINRLQLVQLSLTVLMSLGALAMAYIVARTESKYASPADISEYESSLNTVQWLLTLANIFSYLFFAGSILHKERDKVGKLATAIQSRVWTSSNAGDIELPTTGPTSITMQDNPLSLSRSHKKNGSLELSIAARGLKLPARWSSL